VTFGEKATSIPSAQVGPPDTTENKMDEMAWARKRKPPVTLREKSKPPKQPRTDSNIGPIHLTNGKPSKVVVVGSRRPGID